jgi:hypothetical protein
VVVIIIIVTVIKSYSVYMKYYSKQGEKIVVLVRILMSKSGFEDEVLIKLIVGVVNHVTIDELGPVDYRGSNRFLSTVVIVIVNDDDNNNNNNNNSNR